MKLKKIIIFLFSTLFSESCICEIKDLQSFFSILASTKASTSSSKAIISSEENDDDSSSWSRFKTKVSECFWDFEAELADWFGLNASKFYEELEMKKDLEREEDEDRRRREEQDGVEMTKMETATLRE